MNKSQMRVRPSFLLGLFVVFVIIPLILAFLLPVYAPSGKLEAKLHAARDEEAIISLALKQRAVEIGGLTNVETAFVRDALFSTNEYFVSRTNIQGHVFNLRRVPANQTNVQGQILDLWEIPYRITVIAPTNLIIQSAGPDKIFGTKDDIIFNSASNDFVKP